MDDESRKQHAIRGRDGGPPKLCDTDTQAWGRTLNFLELLLVRILRTLKL